jgi:hypothetical protein
MKLSRALLALTLVSALSIPAAVYAESTPTYTPANMPAMQLVPGPTAEQPTINMLAIEGPAFVMGKVILSPNNPRAKYSVDTGHGIYGVVIADEQIAPLLGQNIEVKGSLYGLTYPRLVFPTLTQLPAGDLTLVPGPTPEQATISLASVKERLSLTGKVVLSTDNPRAKYSVVTGNGTYGIVLADEQIAPLLDKNIDIEGALYGSTYPRLVFPIVKVRP